MKKLLLKHVAAAAALALCGMTAAQAACTASYSTRNDWVNGFVIDVTVKNTGSTTVNGWNVSWSYGNPVELVSAPWNSYINVSGKNISAVDNGVLPNIPPGGSAYFGLAVKYNSGSKPNPGALKVTGNGCTDVSALYVDPVSTAAIWVKDHPSDGRTPAVAENIANRPSARWFGGWSGDITSAVNSYVSAAAARREKPVLVAYNIPGRDCGQYSAGGSASIEAYQAWIRGFANGLGNRQAIVVLEPDALPQLDCLSEDGKAARLQLFQYAVAQFKAVSPNSKIYLDIGNSAWLSPADAASRLASAGIGNAWGFSLNISNYRTDAEANPYGIAISNELQKQRGYTKPFVVDTSRNGAGPAGTEWCDPAGRKVGVLPTQYPAGHQPEMTLWIKSPGESDGCAAAAGTFAPELAYKLIYGYY